MESISCHKCGKIHDVIDLAKAESQEWLDAYIKAYGEVFYCDTDRCYYPVNIAIAEVSDVGVTQKRIEF